MTSTPANSSLTDNLYLNQVLLLALEQIELYLQDFANSEEFVAKMRLAFGETFDPEAVLNLGNAWKNQDFSIIPAITILSSAELNGANGAYAAATNTIYLSQEFLTSHQGDVTDVISVILEEIGHWVDSQINTVDSVGDEGAIFSALVQGNSLDDATLVALKTEDDSGIIIIDGEVVAVEQATNTIQTATGDGGLRVTVNEFGGFSGAIYDPVGSKTPSDTTYDSFVALGIIGTNGTTGARTGLQSSASNNEVFTNFTNTTTNSTFTVTGLKFQLNQNVQNNLNATQVRIGSRLNQTYTITNTTNQTINFDLVRYVDGDLGFDGSRSDGGGRIVQNEQEILFETDAGGTGQTDTTFFGITATGGTIPTTNRWELDDYSSLSSRVLGGNSLRNTIVQGDSNSDQFIDAGSEYDVALALRNVFSLAPGASTTYTTITRFGSGGADQLDVTPPTGGISNLPATTVGNNINVNWGATDPSGIRNYDVFVSVDGAAFTQWQTDVTTTSAVYTGEVGKTYTFYSLATDNQGNEQIATTATRTSTQVINPITLAVSPTNVNEDGNSNLVYTFTRSGNLSTALTANFNVSGNATFNTDYTQIDAASFTDTTGTVTFAAGASTATVTVNPTDDTTIESDETVILTLASGAGYTVGTTAGVSGTISNDDFPLISLAVSPTSVVEDGTANLVYTFTRTEATTNALTVNYGISGTADTSDYSGATPGTDKTITFAAGSSTATVTVDPTADTTIESDETVILTLATGAGYIVGTTTDVSGTITNDDTAVLPNITLAVAPSSVPEDETANLVYTFTRTEATTNALTVNYGISGTADTSDYSDATPGTGKTITFAAGSSTAIVTIDPTADTTIESDETVALTIASGTGYTIGTTGAVTGTIIDDDTLVVPGTLSFSSPQFSIQEDGTPIADVTVTRADGNDGAVSATINFKDGTAKASSDYNNTGITVNFADGEISKTVNIPILNNTTAEPNETLQLLLTNPTGGASVGTQNTAKLTIIDDDGLSISGFPQGTTGSNKGQTTIVIAGQKFLPTDEISLVSSTGTATTASKVYWVNDTEAWATFNLQGLTTGRYDVKVANGQNSFVSNDSFTVTDGSLGNIQVKLSYPANGVVTVKYTNVGQTDVVAPLLRIVPTNAQVTYPEENTVSATLRQLLNLSLGTSDDGPAGILAPGENGEFSFAYTPNGNGLISFAVEQVQPNEVINWASIKAESRADYSFINDAGWDAIWSNLTAAVGTTAGQFQAVMTENANYLSQLGQETSDLTRLFAFEWKQAVNTLTNVSLISTTDVVDAAPGLSLTFNRTFYQSIAERYNLGGLGRGWASQWDLRATTDSKGDVIVRSVGDLQRVFEKQTDGVTYLEDGGATLTITNGQYRLKEVSGLVSLFGTDGKLSYVEDTNANRITLEYANNNLTKLVHTNGDSLTLAYNAQGRISQITDSTAQVTSYSYDAAGENLLSVTSPDGTISYTYDIGTVAAKKHSLLSVKSDLGYERTFEYDNQGRLTKEFSNEQTQSLTYSYDSTGGVTITDSKGASQTILLDDRGNGGQIRGVNNQNLIFSYDADGNLIGATLPNGSKTGYTYDTNGNLTQQTNLLGQDVKFTYDATFNQLTGFIDPKGNGVNYTYDTKGYLTKITYPDGSSEQFSVDALGNITSAVNRRGSTIGYTYDASGLLTKKQYADGSSVSYGYDTKGNLTSVTDATGTIAMEYDVANQLTKINYPTGRSLTYTYNADGQRTKLVSQDGYTVNYSYDTVGRLKTLTDGTGQSIISYDYDSAGRLTKETNGNGTYTTYQYDLQSQLTQLINYKADNTVNSKFEYAYDNLGRRTSMTTLEGIFQYGYDATGQLTSVVTPTNRTINYQYDAAGNRIGVTDNGTTTNYNTNNLNQYTNVGNALYTYDKDGNLISKTQGGQTSTYTYDVENRLTKVVTPQGTWEYQYDGLGNRVATVLNGQRTEYLLDPFGLGDVVGEYNGSTLVANYTHGLGLVSRVSGSNSNYYDADAIGSTVGLTATDGSYVNRYSYLPFGEDLTKVEGVANSFEYVGQWGVMDEGNGLDFMRARFYDSSLGRFTAVDPLGVNAGDANFYRYVFNDPIQNNDPSGEIAPLVVAAIGGFLIGGATDILIQAGSQYLSGQDININWTSVGTSAVFGAVGGGIGAGLRNTTKVSGQVFSHWFPDRWAKSLPSSFGNFFNQNHWLGRLNGQYVSQKFHYWTDYYATIKGLSKEAFPGQKFLEGIRKVGTKNVDKFINFNLIPRTPLWLTSSLLFSRLKGGTYNDPHLQTLDGIGYDFQTVGEFTLVKSTTDDFEIQTRQQPWGNSTSASANSAIAIKIGGQRIAIYANQTNSLLINGTAVTLPEGGLYAVGQNLIIREGSKYSIVTANNDLILVDNRGTFLNINLGLADNRQGKVVGLLGNFNDNRNDDFALRNGTVIGGTITDQQLYGDYAASWRITQANSLFDYASGQTTATFTDLTFPRNIITTASLTPEQRAAAEQIARNAGITDPDVLEDIILDIFLSNGNTEFIQGALNGATDQQRIETVSAPNTLINPDGLGSQHYLTAGAVIPYTIRFANNAAAGTTPVAQVTITQTLDTDLDFNTFTLQDFGFGAITIDVPNGAQNYSQRIDLRTTRGVFVDVNAAIETSTGVVTWTFTAIDPATGNAADSATQGFLPPNDQNGVGSGFIGYSVQPKANSANNTRVDAQASITFNTQTPIQTIAVFNTLDSDIPSSQVNALPANSNADFTVSWTGSDNGSGIAAYDIFASTDGGEFVLWKDDITATSAIYNGQTGKTYSFYSVATDNLGQIETAPTQGDATTAISTIPSGNNSPTLANAISDQNAKQGTAFNFQVPRNTFSDPDAVNPYKNLVIFGDSLSDTGNAYKASGNTFPPSPPNYQGRASNGLIWVDYFAPDLQFTNPSIQNYAFFGANTGVSNTFGQTTVPGLLTQIQQFKTINANSIGKDGLYVIWAGANDFLNLATDPTQAVTNAVTNISSAIITLAGLGAKEIVVGNLPDLGATPASIASNNVANARAISLGFNTALNQALTNLEPALNVNLSLVDNFGSITAVQTNPANYKFTNITQPLITATNPVNPDQYAFWDDVHPTTRLHQLVTDTFENTLLNDGVIPDLIKYSATLADGSKLPDWLNFNSTTRTFSGTPNTGNVGKLDVKVIATDKAGATVNDIFTLAVNQSTTVGTPEDDKLIATPGSQFDGQNNIVFTGAGKDEVDLSTVSVFPNSGNNIVDLGSGEDTIFVNKGDRAFGSDGNDTFDARDGQGGNRISGGVGDDTFYLGSNDRALGGDGNDIFRVSLGGNLISGGAGADQFWIVNAELPKAANTVLDFQLGTDVIGIQGAVSLGITTSTLKLNQVGGDTAISFNNQTLATLTSIQASSLSLTDSKQFVLA
jgi:RHS repeat-associated protein